MEFLDKLLRRGKTPAEETADAEPEASPAAPVPAIDPAPEQPTDTVVELADRGEDDEPPAEPAGPGPAAA